MLDLIFAIVACTITTTASYSPEVTISWGTIQGITKPVDDLGHVNIFYNIPYAQPPVGPLRFRRPLPLTRTNEEKEFFSATDPSIACYSMPVGPLAAANLPANETEDCLRLTIWSPEKIIETGDLKPVLVFIHGGGFLVDLSRDSRIHDGEVLSLLGDMVIVSIRYRLGIFGCLYLDSDEGPGNLALADQALALEWIHDNIKYFGGNPNMITLSGESAGAISSAMHFVRSFGQTNQLFHRLILQSGATLTNVNEPASLSVMRSSNIAKKLGCSQDTSDKPIDLSDSEVVTCLKSIEATQLIAAYVDPSTNPVALLVAPSCLVDAGEYSQAKVDKDFVSGQIPSGLSILVTILADEGTVISGFIPETRGVAYKDLIGPVFSLLYNDTVTNQLVKLYYDRIYIENKLEEENTFLQILGDRYFKCPALFFAEKASMANNTVYTMKYTYASPALKEFEPQLFFGSKFGPRHVSDLIYTFGYVLRKPDSFTQADIDLAHEIISIWRQFVHYGTAKWPAYEESEVGIILPHQYEINPTKKDKSTNYDDRYFYCQVWKKLIYGTNF